MIYTINKNYVFQTLSASNTNKNENFWEIQLISKEFSGMSDKLDINDIRNVTEMKFFSKILLKEFHKKKSSIWLWNQKFNVNSS